MIYTYSTAHITRFTGKNGQCGQKKKILGDMLQEKGEMEIYAKH